MSVSGARIFASWVMAILCPLSMMAADTGTAIVHSTGGVLVNGSEVADSTAITNGDLIETKHGFVANLDAEGSSVLIQGESIVRFQGDSLSLEHGSVSVGTSTAMRVHVKCIRVEPVSTDRTQYDVTDLTGRVDVEAHKNDVRIRQEVALGKPSANSSDESGIVHEGQRASREETICGAPAPPQSAGNPVNTKLIEIGGGAGAGVVVLCLLLCRGKSQSNVSPTQP